MAENQCHIRPIPDFTHFVGSYRRTGQECRFWSKPLLLYCKIFCSTSVVQEYDPQPYYVQYNRGKSKAKCLREQIYFSIEKRLLNISTSQKFFAYQAACFPFSCCRALWTDKSLRYMSRLKPQSIFLGFTQFHSTVQEFSEISSKWSKGANYESKDRNVSVDIQNAQPGSLKQYTTILSVPVLVLLRQHRAKNIAFHKKVNWAMLPTSLRFSLSWSRIRLSFIQIHQLHLVFLQVQFWITSFQVSWSVYYRG